MKTMRGFLLPLALAVALSSPAHGQPPWWYPAPLARADFTGVPGEPAGRSDREFRPNVVQICRAAWDRDTAAVEHGLAFLRRRARMESTVVVAELAAALAAGNLTQARELFSTHQNEYLSDDDFLVLGVVLHSRTIRLDDLATAARLHALALTRRPNCGLLAQLQRDLARRRGETAVIPAPADLPTHWLQECLAR